MGRFATKYFPVELCMLQMCISNTAEGVCGRKPPIIGNYKNQFTIETSKVQVSQIFN